MRVSYHPEFPQDIKKYSDPLTWLKRLPVRSQGALESMQSRPQRRPAEINQRKKIRVRAETTPTTAFNVC